jgi:hypothetical protein
MVPLHIVEFDRAALGVFPHPQTGEVAHRLRLQKATKLDLLTGEIDRYANGDGGKAVGAGSIAFQPNRPLPAVHRRAIREECPLRTPTPAARHRSVRSGLEVQN